MQSRVSTVKLSLALALGLAVVAGGWRAVVAFNPQPEPPRVWHSGPVTLVPGDVARVNVAYVGDPADLRIPPDPCRFMVDFYDADGNLVGQSGGELVMGRIASIVMDDPPDWDRPVGDVAPRSLTVRARVRVLNRTFGGVSATLEVTSKATLSSRFATPGEWVGFNPQPEPPGDRIGR